MNMQNWQALHERIISMLLVQKLKLPVKCAQLKGRQLTIQYYNEPQDTFSFQYLELLCYIRIKKQHYMYTVPSIHL